MTGDAGYAAPTPATDGQHIAALFPNGALLCLDSQGQRVWAKHLGVPANHYGHSSSLLVAGPNLIVQYDDSALAGLRFGHGEYRLGDKA